MNRRKTAGSRQRYKRLMHARLRREPGLGDDLAPARVEKAEEYQSLDWPESTVAEKANNEGHRWNQAENGGVAPKADEDDQRARYEREARIIGPCVGYAPAIHARLF